MITSTSNAKVKELLNLQKKAKLRNEKKVFVVEGLRMFSETPRERIVQVYLSESFHSKKGKQLNLSGLTVEILSDTVFSYVSDTKSPQGILCIVKQNDYIIEDVMKAERAHILMLENLQDPGNMGTIMRTAEGAGVTGILMSRDTVDIYNPKVVRSTMGSIYRIPFLYVEDFLAAAKVVKAAGIRIFAAHLDGKDTYDRQDYLGGTAFLIGNEGNGLTPEAAEAADTWIRIPMHGKVESLNAAIASAILMYEVCRQRGE
ncbi:MAG: RNA methyltransferase [Hespellia sp.]|nr:RNA methyltransferase [Hespellia sp.]